MTILDGTLDTPRLLLDRARLDRNAARMRARCTTLGVALRPHLKTAKSVDVARLASGGQPGPVTVSTLAEAEYLAAAGWRDILYATAMAPAKVARAARLQRDTGTRLTLAVDSVAAVRMVAAEAARHGGTFGCLSRWIAASTAAVPLRHRASWPRSPRHWAPPRHTCGWTAS